VRPAGLAVLAGDGARCVHLGSSPRSGAKSREVTILMTGRARTRPPTSTGSQMPSPRQSDQGLDWASYTVFGRTYSPMAARTLQGTGQGKLVQGLTGSRPLPGTYDMYAMTAAHRTLPIELRTRDQPAHGQGRDRASQ
jgi:rare lipoprotein A (peptidoglycan hydrolase)